jgi:thiol-disulfide isomerase/thioredoxin
MSSSSPVEFTSYADALDFWNSSNDKIKVVYFYKKDCPYCDDFVPHVLEKELKDRADKFEWKKVCVDTGGVPFPPSNTPLAYFHIPNTSEEMPLDRTGGTSREVLSADFDAMIEIMDQGKTIDEAFFGDGADMPISAWSQRMRLVKQMFSN